MLSHLLFSISALIILIVLMITYFTLNKVELNSYRIKLYKYLMFIVLITIFVEILCGVFYVYKYEIIYSLLWKLRFILYAVFYLFLCNYFLLFLNNSNVNSIYDVIWDNKNIFKNVLTILYFILIIYSSFHITPYMLGFSSFVFYTDESYLYLFLLFALYIAYMISILIEKNEYTKNEIIILIGTLVFNLLAIFISYRYAEVSFYCDVFVLILVMLYYFKEDADLVRIDEIELLNNEVENSSNSMYDALYENVKDLTKTVNSINIVNDYIKNNKCKDINELNDKLDILNIISNDSINIINDSINYEKKYKLDEIILRLSKLMDVYLLNREVKFIYSIDSNMPSILYGKSTMIYRILLNLLMYSINDTEVGKISIDVKSSIKKDEVFLNIRVSDTGVGMDQNKLVNLFNKKKKLNNDEVNFNLIKKYIESLNGNISVSSKWLVGNTFNINITQKVIDSTPVSNDSSILLEKIVINNCSGKKVIILDNNFKSTRGINNIFKKYGFDVEIITSGKEFINKIKLNNHYDLALISENISDINFMNIISIIRYLDDFISIGCVVAFTSNIVDNDGEYYIKNGFDEYLPKPIDIKKLDYIIKNRCK